MFFEEFMPNEVFLREYQGAPIWPNYGHYGNLSYKRLKPYEMLFTMYGPLVRVNGDSLLVSHPRYIEAIMAISRSNRSALSTMERKRRLSLPIRMPEYELDFNHLSKKYADILNFKPNHFNKRIEVASDQLINRMYYTRNLQHEVPNFDEELYHWGLQSIFSCLFSRDCSFLQDPTRLSKFGPKSGVYQTYQSFLNASHCLAEAEAGPLGRLVRQRSVANHIDVMNGLVSPFPSLSRDLDRDIILHGYGIPKGIQVHMINEVANMRKDMFPHTTSFTPERWPRMGKEPMLPHNYQLLPLAPVASLLHAHISVLTAKVSYTA
ncbi:unnamed protein product [Nezara viridula]|uniref:Uncharacterized protein n=1 Tax=Nezara viridula TaxID=85310 RepID=A0A9P0HJU3_NEZVI|nr:unnamed protein product [Nezara viridula]